MKVAASPPKVTPQETPPEILIPEEAAELLRIGLSTLYRLTRRRVIPSFKAGRLIRYRRSLLLALLEKGGPR